MSAPSASRTIAGLRLFGSGHRITSWRPLGSTWGPCLVAFASALACAPVVRPPTFQGASETLTEVSLLGPFDGQVVDTATSEPIQGATVVAVWSYDQGDGFIGPAGSITETSETDAAGRYRISRPAEHRGGENLRLVSFRLFVYKRGYAAYRSDTQRDGSPRTDFVARHNQIAMHKWEAADSHADHLLFLAPTRELASLTQWERSRANAELYRRSGGLGDLPEEPIVNDATRPSATLPLTPAAAAPLDAKSLLTPEEIVLRTGQLIEFEVASLSDIPASSTYHGVHLRALEHDESFDVSFRVWRNPPDGFDPIIATFNATLPDVPVSDDVTEETWVADFETVRAVAFIDRGRSVAVLVTCGVGQCVDISTTLILAKLAHGNLDRIGAKRAPEPSPAEPAAVPDADVGSGIEPTTDPVKPPASLEEPHEGANAAPAPDAPNAADATPTDPPPPSPSESIEPPTSNPPERP